MLDPLMELIVDQCQRAGICGAPTLDTLTDMPFARRLDVNWALMMAMCARW